MFIFTIPVPAAEAFEGKSVSCESCGTVLTGDAYPIGEVCYCEACVAELEREVRVEAVAEARATCRITRPLPPYDPALEYRCTPEEYADGDRASYTPNAHLCSCRHRCTNYEELIRNLDRHCPLDQITYRAIRVRVDALLCKALGFPGTDDYDDYEYL